MNDKINKIPVTYEDWLDLGHVIIPTDQKKARVSWKKDDFSLTKEEWKNNYSKAQIALRLDSHIYNLKTVQMSNDKGTWFGWEISKVGPVKDQGVYGVAKSFAEQVGKGAVEVKHESQEETKKSLNL